MIRVLIVDDSATTRELIRAVLDAAPDIEVIAEATDGIEGVELTAKLAPDVVTMDVNMPQMNGYEATIEIMQAAPTPIVVVTTLSQQEMMGGGFDILLAGALEIVEKPSTLTGRDYQTVGEELIAKIRIVSQVSMAR